MVDKQLENSGNQGVLANAANAAEQAQPKTATENPAQPDAKKEAAKEQGAAMSLEKGKDKTEPGMSKGEKVFNWTTYTGLNYWVNLISSIYIADRFINPATTERKGTVNKFVDGMMNREKLDKWISSTTKFLNKSGMSLNKAHNNSKIGWESFILLSGGTLLLFPLKYLEDNKRKIVHWLNDKLGVDQTAPDGHKKTPEEIHIEQEQPKQSVKNLIWRRILGTVSVVTTGIVVDHALKDKNTKLPPEKYDLGWAKVNYDSKVQGGKARIENKVFGWIQQASKNLTGKEFAKNGTFARLTRLAILDSVFTVITAGVMKVTNGAKRGKMPQEIDDSNDPAVVRDVVDRITTADEIRDKPFAEKIEKRVNRIIEAKENGGGNKSFVDSLQQAKEIQPAGVGV